MSAALRRLAVVGLGLLGGSVALAARRRGVAERVVATGRRPAALAEARRRGLVDETAPLAEAVRGADLVLLATPVAAMEGILREAAPHLAPGALVTDVGSVKGCLAETLPGLLPSGVTYVGSHPMAGSHLRGWEHARADLFEGAACAVTPGSPADEAAAARIEAFWRALGARVVRRDPETHDREVAWTSHVPHVLAFAFAGALADAPAGAAELAGPGFRDFTRIARSDAELWSEILVANRKAIAGPLQRAGERLADLARALEGGDPEALERSLAEAREALARVSPEPFDARSGGENPEIPSPELAGTQRKTTEE
jgi:cyclohexadieny/prephenate dehydrogenase